MNHIATKGKFATLARLGFASRALVYFLIGGFALMAAAGSGGGTTGSTGALAFLQDQSFGNIILGVVGLGLVGYALWRFTQAFGNTATGDLSDAKRVGKKIGYGASGLIHSGLAIYAFMLAAGTASGSSSSSQGWTAKLMTTEFGPWLMSAIGVGVLIAGCYQIYKAVSAKFKRNLDVPHEYQDTVYPVCRTGIIARSIVFGILAWFFLQAATAERAGSIGIDRVLEFISGMPAGQWLLGLMALGLMAFGVYSAIQAMYRRIEHSPA